MILPPFRQIAVAVSLFLLTAPVAVFAQAAPAAPAAPAPAAAAIPGALDRAFSSMNGGAPTGMTMSLQRAAAERATPVHTAGTESGFAFDVPDAGDTRTMHEPGLSDADN